MIFMADRYVPRAARIVLDSNLLLLLLIGSYDIEMIEWFKRVSDFTADDFNLLQSVLEGKSLVATPHILTEVSNLANSLGEPLKTNWLLYYGKWIARIAEDQFPASELAAQPEFSLFGLTDAALCKLCSDAIVITADYRLSGYLRKREALVVSFDELRLSEIRPEF
jgi:hypothetical protein